MKLTFKNTINAPIPEVWDKLAIHFDRAEDWMSLIPKSVEMTDGVMADGAPMVGRVCDL
ncbi:MAG: SRPBCC family protein, partial [Chloroflexi bacterium]|nr:SRPBCC family protein [Chloroflexota bacterium]